MSCIDSRPRPTRTVMPFGCASALGDDDCQAPVTLAEPCWEVRHSAVPMCTIRSPAISSLHGRSGPNHGVLVTNLVTNRAAMADRVTSV